MRHFDETSWWNILMRHFDETFWGGILKDILQDILMRHFNETLWWDILIAFEELSCPVITYDDLWYGDDVNGIALRQFWLSLGYL